MIRNGTSDHSTDPIPVLLPRIGPQDVGLGHGGIQILGWRDDPQPESFGPESDRRRGTSPRTHPGHWTRCRRAFEGKATFRSDGTRV